jgi:dihydrofolate reductase
MNRSPLQRAETIPSAAADLRRVNTIERTRMRKLIAWDMMTLDGCFEGKSPWDLAFHGSIWGEELEAFSLEQLNAAGTLLFGRKTYEGMASYWSNETGAIAHLMNTIEKVVVSRSLNEAAWSNTRLVRGEGTNAVEALKQSSGKDVYAFGSADLLSSLLRHGLVDELRVCIAPVVLGAGKPLFKPSEQELTMNLLEARALRTGGVIVRYAPVYGR